MARDYEGMIEQQGRNVLAALSDPSSPWYGLPYDTVDQWMHNSPAGFDAGMVPGQVIDQNMLSQIFGRLNTPGLYEGIDNGMTLDQYLADPRSMIKVENGQYVYRPEQSQGDFVSKDRESFLESLGAFPMVLGAFAAPYLASLGIAGAAAPAAGADFASSFAPTLTEAAAAPGLVSPTASLADMASVLGSGGALEVGGLAGLSDAALGLPAGGLSAALGGTGITIPGALGNLTLDAAGNIVSTAVAGAAPNLSVPVNGAGTSTTAAAGTAAPTGLSKLLKDHLGLDVDPSTLDLIGKGLGLAAGVAGSNQQTDALKDLNAQMTAQRAPFLNKAVGYLNNPDSFFTSPEATGAANATMRALSTKFGNPGTSPTAQGLATGALYDRYANTVNSLGSLGLSGQGIQANLGQQIAQSSGQPFAIAGRAIADMTSDNAMTDMFAKMFRQQFSLA